MKQARAKGNAEQRRSFRGRPFLRIMDDARAIFVPAPANFFSNVADLDHLADRSRFGDERPDPRPANDDTRRLQFAQCAVRGHPRNPEPVDQFGFGRHPVAGLQLAVARGVGDALLDRRVARRRAIILA